MNLSTKSEALEQRNSATCNPHKSAIPHVDARFEKHLLKTHKSVYYPKACEICKTQKFTTYPQGFKPVKHESLLRRDCSLAGEGFNFAGSWRAKTRVFRRGLDLARLGEAGARSARGSQKSHLRALAAFA